MSKSSKLRTGFLEMAATRILTFGTAFLTNIVLSRWLGPAGRGEYGIYTTAVALLSVPFGSGVSAANTIIAGQRPQVHRQLAANSIIYGILVSLPIIFAPFFLPKFLQQWVPFPAYYWGLVGGGLWLIVSLGAILGIILGLQNYRVYTFTSGMQSLFNCVIITFALVVLHGGVFSAIISNLAAGFTVLLLSLLLFWRISPDAAPLRLNLPLFAETTKIGFRGAFINTLDNLHFRVDILLIGWMLGSAAAGIYAQAATLTATLSFFPPLLNNLIFSHVPSAGNKNARAIIQVAHLMSLATAIGLVFVIILGRSLLVFLFTVEFLPAYWPWVILFVAEIFKAHTAVTAGFLAGLGYPRIYLAGSIIGLIGNLGLNLVLIPIWGSVGAASASAISYVVLSAIYLYGMTRHAKLSAKDVLPSFTFFRETVLPLLFH